MHSLFFRFCAASVRLNEPAAVDVYDNLQPLVTAGSADSPQANEYSLPASAIASVRSPPTPALVYSNMPSGAAGVTYDIVPHQIVVGTPYAGR
jgi:hypothetical protein